VIGMLSSGQFSARTDRVWLISRLRCPFAVEDRLAPVSDRTDEGEATTSVGASASRDDPDQEGGSKHGDEESGNVVGAEDKATDQATNDRAGDPERSRRQNPYRLTARNDESPKTSHDQSADE